MVALVLAVSLGMPVFPQPWRPAEIPFQFSRAFGLMLIRAEVNGRPAVFVLDTASNHTTVSSRFVDVTTPPLRDTVSSEKGSGFSGTGIFTRASLKVGPVVWRDHQILAMDLKEISKSLGENIDGLLGMDFLNEFESVMVDLRQHKLILR
jgi:hypothetical protein